MSKSEGNGFFFAIEGPSEWVSDCTGPSLWVWFLEDSFNKGTIRIETIRCSFQQLYSNPLRLRLRGQQSVYLE